MSDGDRIPDIRQVPSRLAHLTAHANEVARSRWGLPGYFLGLAVLVWFPVLGPGYLLTLDMIFAPGTDYVGVLLHVKGPLYYGRLPLQAGLAAITTVVPDWTVQQLLLVAIVTISGLSASTALRGRSTPARLFAGTMYAINPFVYVRLLAGHWAFLLGYAVLPIAIVVFAEALAGRTRIRRAVAWSLPVSIADPHAAVLLAVGGGSVAGTTLVRSRREWPHVLRRLAAYLGAALAVNAYWLLPAAWTIAGGGSQLSRISAGDLSVFAARGTLLGNIPLSTAALFGFWRGGYRYSIKVIPLAVVLGLFGVMVCLAVYGWLGSRNRPAMDGLLVAAVLGAVLGMGVATRLSEPLFRLLAETPIGAGMRDSQKFVGLTVLGISVLGALGVDRLWEDLTAGSDSLELPRSAIDRLLPGLVVIALLLVPLIYAIPMVGGLGGGVQPTAYPSDWATVDDRLDADGGPHRTLFLPWHQYLSFDWTNGIIANPAPFYFDARSLDSRALEVGTATGGATDPTRMEIRRIFHRDTLREFGPAVAPLGVKYVVIMKTTDYHQYWEIATQPELRTVTETESMILLENLAYASAPPPRAWPRAGPIVPGTAMVVGGVVSIVTLFTIVSRTDYGRGTRFELPSRGRSNGPG